MAKQIAKTYGDALFELAVEENKLDLIAEDVSALITAFSENEELTRLMSHPKVSKEEKLDIMTSILKGRVADEIDGFVRIIIEKGRYMEIAAIFAYFMNRYKEYKNIGTAYVTTAVSLSEVQRQQVEKRLLETTGYEKVEVQYSVDEALIGGMVIRIGDRVVDSSIQTKLYELTKELSKIQLSM